MIARVTLALLVVAGTVAGWWTFWFLTDDAYIAFRYASNAVHGRGFVWNPAPFWPVEGYTSFLWTAGLAAIWWITGLQPPQVANWLSLGCALGTLLLVGRTVDRLPWPQQARIPVLVGVMLATLTNRTFLAWTSSGLETALFDLTITGWLCAAILRGPRMILTMSVWAALGALSRPDGLLLVAGTVAVALTERLGPKEIAGFSSFGVVGAHLLWRRWTYGWWLPNTFYAKVTDPWPEAGARYLLAFVLEYGLMVPLVTGGVWLVSRDGWRATRPVMVVAAVMAFHLGYYTFLVGGDHFEFRIYAWLVPFVPVLLAASLAHTRWMVPTLYAWILLSLPIPWTHWWATQDRVTRDDTHKLVEPIAHRFPAFLRPYVTVWDAQQAWLIPRHIGMRHQEHKVFHLWLLDHTPPRKVGSRLAWEPDHHLRADGSCGVIGWTLPHVAIIDTFGLSDPIIAHRDDTRVPGERLMAHERDAPPGYVECFGPDIELPRREYLVKPRARPLIDERIEVCQERFAP